MIHNYFRRWLGEQRAKGGQSSLSGYWNAFEYGALQAFKGQSRRTLYSRPQLVEAEGVGFNAALRSIGKGEVILCDCCERPLQSTPPGRKP